MVFGEELMKELFFDQAIGRVLYTLPALVANHVALVGEFLAVQRTQEIPHAIAFQPQRQFQLVGGQSFEVVGAVEVRSAVDVAGTGRLEVTEMSFGSDVLRPFKHHVLKQVRKSGAAGTFVSRTDVIPDIGRHQWKPVILVENYVQAILERVFFVFDLRRRRCGSCRSGKIRL